MCIDELLGQSWNAPANLSRERSPGHIHGAVVSHAAGQQPDVGSPVLGPEGHVPGVLIVEVGREDGGGVGVDADVDPAELRLVLPSQVGH
jgi:hypothetical protein